MRRAAERAGFTLRGRPARLLRRALAPASRPTTRCTRARAGTTTRRRREGDGSMDPNKLTMRSRQALEAAHAAGAGTQPPGRSTPEHVLRALLADPEGVVYPLLHHLGVTPTQLRDRVDEALDAAAQGLHGEPGGGPVRAADRPDARGRGDGGRAAHRRVRLHRAPAARDARRARRRRRRDCSQAAGVTRDGGPGGPRRGPGAPARDRARTPRTPTRRSRSTAATSPQPPARASSTR